ncbi:thylakoid lumen 18.3 kDa protein [Artemisia annua]|uniref:Thylakoid lumen 18.3 kDa protein n=1 Tax=Artemisia annua TaxID=35608 RepID=A0A2U1NJL6_ARTAN|nr:thylakoid lumen 18.3 kDa protein [Artemisia annua]
METILAPHSFSSLFNLKQHCFPKTNSITTLTNTKTTTISCNLKKDTNTFFKSLVPTTNTNWLTNGLAALAISLALNFTPVSATAFASEFNVLNDGPPKDSYVVDDAGVLSRVTRADLKNLLSDLEYRKKIRINFVTVRKLTSKADAFEYADQVLERWYPTLEEGNNKGIVVLVTSQKEGAVTGGPEFIKAVGDTVLDATVSQNLPGNYLSLLTLSLSVCCIMFTYIACVPYV